jgi:hypothetical protein
MKKVGTINLRYYLQLIPHNQRPTKFQKPTTILQQNIQNINFVAAGPWFGNFRWKS